tara:strand:+ start:3287 stop:3835 length:549 start_codon:yes stop_codon:yes gene_type:complete
MINREIKGEISTSFVEGDYNISFLKRECPYCWTSVEQPTEHLYWLTAGSFGTYVCSKCSTCYYFVGDSIYQYIPEAQLVHLDSYVKRPSRLDTIRTYRNLYYRAKEFEWFNDIRLDVVDNIVENIWTMPVEVAAQMMEKEKTGKAPGYSIGFEWLGERDEHVPLNGDKFLEALEYLKEKELV